MMRQICIRFVAFGVLFMLVGGGLWLYPGISQPLLVLSGVSFVIATGIRIKIWRDETADPYSLHKLNEIVREGIKALLARRESEMAAEDQRTANLYSTWEDLTAVQFANETLLHELNDDRDRFKPYGGDPIRQQNAWERFQKYAYQWY